MLTYIIIFNLFLLLPFLSFIWKEQLFDFLPAFIFLSFIGIMITFFVSLFSYYSTSKETLKIINKAVLGNGICLEVETVCRPLIFRTIQAEKGLDKATTIVKITDYSIWGLVLDYNYYINETVLE